MEREQTGGAVRRCRTALRLEIGKRFRVKLLGSERDRFGRASGIGALLRWDYLGRHEKLSLGSTEFIANCPIVMIKEVAVPYNA